MSQGGVDIQKCILQAEKSNDNINIRLTGNYDYIVGPPGFLATICLQEKHKNASGFEQVQNYYMHFDADIGSISESFTADIGKIKLDHSYPFMLIKNVNGKLKVYPDMSPDGWENIFLNQITNIIRIKESE